jgi:hypothetical protein
MVAWVTRAFAGALAAALLVPAPARAEVVLGFWSRDFGRYFPHAFVTVKGTLDATGEPVDTSWGFTLNALSPKALFGSVKAHIDVTAKDYMRGSEVHFTVRLTDQQYLAIKRQVAAWGQPEVRWNLNKRNCVHFVAEVARHAGLSVVEDRRLMRKPKSFTRSLIPLNPDRVTVIERTGAEWFAHEPAAEVFGVPDKVGGSVLQREVERD